MAKLTLALKGEYFDAIRAGTKLEEFRLVTPYWRKRLEGRHYDFIELTRGYPRRGDPHFGPEPVVVFAINVQQPAKPMRCFHPASRPVG